MLEGQDLHKTKYTRKTSVANHHETYEPRLEKTCLNPYANNKGANQPTQALSLEPCEYFNKCLHTH